MEICNAVYDRLIEDATLISLLGTYTDVSPEKPCVFVDPLVPESAPRPYVWISSAIRNKHWGAKLKRGRQLSIEIWIATDNNGSVTMADQIAEQVLALLHEEQLILDSGTRVVIADVDGPIELDTDESIIGRKLTPTYNVI